MSMSIPSMSIPEEAGEPAGPGKPGEPGGSGETTEQAAARLNRAPAGAFTPAGGRALRQTADTIRARAEGAQRAAARTRSEARSEAGAMEAEARRLRTLADELTETARRWEEGAAATAAVQRASEQTRA